MQIRRQPAQPAKMTMDGGDETYILLLLTDSNLPTGSFVASSGFESFVKHGFASTSGSASTVTFIRDSLMAYGRNALPFVSDAHRIVLRFADSLAARDKTVFDVEESRKKALSALAGLDVLYHAMTLNHVSRRASESQGVALLTLYSKGFSHPFSTPDSPCHQSAPMSDLLEDFKSLVRKKELHGHLPICWGALTGALSLSLERSQFLHLFLHARSLVSASVRLNHIGPYHAQQLLMHAIRPLIMIEASQSRDLRTGLLEETNSDFDEIDQGPANTWPLGEILAGRHDLQHSRIFNS